MKGSWNQKFKKFEALGKMDEGKLKVSKWLEDGKVRDRKD